MLEDPSIHRPHNHPPRASRVLAKGELIAVETEIWMGGAHTPHGEALLETEIGNSWVIDCAGDIDVAYRTMPARWVSCVFPDIDGRPAAETLITSVVREASEAIRRAGSSAPDRVYIMCQHGMNRSGLVSGLILRSLGLEPEDVIQRIRAARPGALANDGFLRMLRQS